MSTSPAARSLALPRADRPEWSHEPVRTGQHDVPLGLLLDVDREYRARARALPRIPPRRFTRRRDRWRPILHTTRGPWHCMALFSNTALAHRLRRTRDWVVIFCHRDNQPERHYTVVTETRGLLEGRRVVRGREDECA